jgi:glycosyltransferase involved in cell wall biosynthesis
MNPKVSFVVPCYNFGHLLPDCINSILSQSYPDFEILIMDDCSPDNTPAVAQSFTDPRVRYIRNDPNLGHLRNYNKGIGMARGKYVWLISGDDRLRVNYALDRYVRLLEAYPNVGYVICQAVKLRNGLEVGILDYSVHAPRDRIFDGRKFLAKRLIKGNAIVAASGMARKECYDKISLFPLDMPWSGDWYLWCVFALCFDVAYIAEPLVCYREHQLSMTTDLMNGKVEKCSSEDIAMPWIIKRRAEQLGHGRLSRYCLEAAAQEYARSIASKRYRAATSSVLTLEQFEQSLAKNAGAEQERELVRGRVYAGLADHSYWKGDLAMARRLYSRALERDPWMVRIWAKRLLLSCGDLGALFRKGFGRLRRAI